MATSAKVTVWSHVWVEDPDDAWVDGQAEEANSEEFTVNCSGKTGEICNLCSYKKFDTELKSKITYNDLTSNLCSVLSTQQLYRICTLCKDKDDGDHNVSPVISNLRFLMTNEDEHSICFLLDDDSSIPFETDEISN